MCIRDSARAVKVSAQGHHVLAVEVEPVLDVGHDLGRRHRAPGLAPGAGNQESLSLIHI